MAARLIVVVNPAAASGRRTPIVARSIELLKEAGHAVEVLQADTAQALERRLRDRVRSQAPDAVVSIGGDGTVHLVANVLARLAIPLGIVPAGSGNDIARALGVAADPQAAVRRILDALTAGTPPVLIDLVRTSTGRWFVAVLSAGFDAAVNERANGLSALPGRFRYLAAVLIELRRLHPRRYLLTMDRDPRQVDAVLVCAGNLTTIGGGMRITPNARADDGLLDVLVATPLSRRRLLGLLPRVFAGTHVRDDHVDVERAKVVTIDVTGRPAPVAYADGERIGTLPLTLETVRAALPVLGARPF